MVKNIYQVTERLPEITYQVTAKSSPQQKEKVFSYKILKRKRYFLQRLSK